MKTKYLISGIGPSNSGVGYLMQKLIPLANQYEFEVVCPKYQKQSIWKYKYNFFYILIELWKRFIDKYNFFKQILTIRNSEIILVHPQTIGFRKFINLIKKNSDVKFYVMDNSFFCIKSYNTLYGKECLKCVSNFQAIDLNCKPFPIRYKKEKNIFFLEELKKISSKIIFYTQNLNQELLLKNHFGSEIKIQRVGLETGENFEENFYNNSNKSYDVIYHGANVEAKGLFYFISLAELLPKYSFFIPYDKSLISLDKDMPKNIICSNMQWNTGLKEVVINSKLVLCPSIWSAPIEGALLKSIHYNGNVAVVFLKYSFGSELSENIVLKLSENIEKAAEQVKNHLLHKKDFSYAARQWLRNFYKNECDLSLLFSEENKK